MVEVDVPLTGRNNLSIDTRKLLVKLTYHFGPSSATVCFSVLEMSVELEIKVVAVISVVDPVTLRLDSVVVGEAPEDDLASINSLVVRVRLSTLG